MASKVQICNEALQNIGARYITSLEEDTTEAIECNLRFNSAKRALLEMHPWNFAMKRVALNANLSAPAFNYSYEFNLPSDFLWLYMTKEEEIHQTPAAATYDFSTHIANVPYTTMVDKYRIEGRKLVSNSSEVSIIYVADIEDTEHFSATFTQLLARYLGGLIAYKRQLTNHSSNQAQPIRLALLALVRYHYSNLRELQRCKHHLLARQFQQIAFYYILP